MAGLGFALARYICPLRHCATDCHYALRNLGEGKVGCTQHKEGHNALHVTLTHSLSSAHLASRRFHLVLPGVLPGPYLPLLQ